MDHREVDLLKEDIFVKNESSMKNYNEKFNFVSFVGLLCIIYGITAIIIMYFNELGFHLINVVIVLIGFAILGIELEFTKKETLIEKLMVEQRSLKKHIEMLTDRKEHK
jgi:hypothetical protein